MTVMITSRALLATIFVPVADLAKSSRTFRIPAPFIFPSRCSITVAVRRHAQTRSFIASCITWDRFKFDCDFPSVRQVARVVRADHG